MHLEGIGGLQLELSGVFELVVISVTTSFLFQQECGSGWDVRVRVQGVTPNYSC